MKVQPAVIVRSMLASDWFDVIEIYKDGLNTGHAGFIHNIPSWEEWDNSHIKSCRLVCELEHRVVGWAALSPVSERCVYAGVAEVSVYMSSKCRGIGLGKKLLKQIIGCSEHAEIWTLQSGIFSENEASLAIHQQMGFRQVGFRERIGQVNGIWRDVILLEKRSRLIGNN